MKKAKPVTQLRYKLREIADLWSISASAYHGCRIAAWLVCRSLRKQFAHGNPDKPDRLMRFSVKISGKTIPLVFPRTLEHVMLIREIFYAKPYDMTLSFMPDVIVDCGANIGASTLFLHAKFPQAKIIACEPSPDMYDMLIKNTSEYQNITALPYALSEKDGTAPFTIKKDTLSSSLRTEAGDTTVIVETRTLESLMRQCNREEIGLLKFDIEGAEEHLFSDAMLLSIRAIVGEVHGDLIRVPLGEFIGRLESVFDLSLRPLSKKDRYIVRGIKRESS